MMVPFLHSGHCNPAFTARGQRIMSTLNEQQLDSQVGELSEPTRAFTSLKKECHLSLRS